MSPAEISATRILATDAAGALHAPTGDLERDMRASQASLGRLLDRLSASGAAVQGAADRSFVPPDVAAAIQEHLDHLQAAARAVADVRARPEDP